MRHPLEVVEDTKAEELFELTQEIQMLNRRITYLQEELYAAEDALEKQQQHYEAIISKLEENIEFLQSGHEP